MLWTSPCTFYICCQWTTLILRYWYKRVENKFWLLVFSLILCWRRFRDLATRVEKFLILGRAGQCYPGWYTFESSLRRGMVIYLHYLKICLHLSPCPCTRIHVHPNQLVILVGIHIHHHHGHWHCVVRQTSVDTGIGRRWGQNWSRSSGSPVRSGSRTLLLNHM